MLSVCVCELTSAQTRSPLQLYVILVVLHHLLPLPHFFGPAGSIVWQSDVHSLYACNKTKLDTVDSQRFQPSQNKILNLSFGHGVLTPPGESQQ